MDIHPFETIVNIWPIIIGSVGLVVWLVRLEGRIAQLDKDCLSNEKRVDNLQVKHDALDSKVVSQLASVRESLARIEGALGVKKLDKDERF